jgi:MFS family permease
MFLQYAVPGALLPFYSLRLVSDLGFGWEATAVCCATQAVAVVLASLAAGHVADRWVSPERALAICAALAGIDLWVLAAMHTPWGVFIASLIFWLLAGPLLLLGTTVCFTHLPFPDRQFSGVRLWGTVGWMAMVWLIGYWLSGPSWLAWLQGPRLPDRADAFRIGGVAAWVVALYAVFIPRTPRCRPDNPDLGRGLAPLAALRLLRGPSFITFAVCSLGACVTFPFTTQNTPLLLRELGVADPWLGPAQTLGQVSEILSLFLLPMLILRLGIRGAMLLGLAACVTALTILSFGKPLGLVIASQSLNGLFVAAFLVAGQVYINGQAGGHLRASMQSIVSFINGLGMLLGNLLAAWLREWAGGQLPATFAVGAALTLGLLAIFFVGFREKQDHEQNVEGDEIPEYAEPNWAHRAEPALASNPVQNRS